ncbi:MAG: hypothetical protein ACE5HC_10295 [Candidatus Binatia bacterium]
MIYRTEESRLVLDHTVRLPEKFTPVSLNRTLLAVISVTAHVLESPYELLGPCPRQIYFIPEVPVKPFKNVTQWGIILSSKI